MEQFQIFFANIPMAIEIPTYVEKPDFMNLFTALFWCST